MRPGHPIAQGSVLRYRSDLMRSTTRRTRSLLAIHPRRRRQGLHGLPRRWPLARAASESPSIPLARPPFASSLIEARDRAGLTQQQLARRLGMHQSFVAKYEGGERRIDVLEFLSITHAIGADPVRLLKALMRRSV